MFIMLSLMLELMARVLEARAGAVRGKSTPELDRHYDRLRQYFQ
jgi:hypothetical protein